MLEPSSGSGSSSLDKKKDPLQALIDKFNEQWLGEFTEGDRVVITTLWQRMSAMPEIEDTIAVMAVLSLRTASYRRLLMKLQEKLTWRTQNRSPRFLRTAQSTRQ